MADDHDVASYRATGENDSLTVTVVEAIAQASDCGTTAFELNDYVDPDALNALFRPRPDGSERFGGRVTFDVEGYSVVVKSNGEVVVHSEDEADGE